MNVPAIYDDGLVAIPKYTCNHFDEVAQQVERLDALIAEARELGIDTKGMPLDDYSHLRAAISRLGLRISWRRLAASAPDPGDDG